MDRLKTRLYNRRVAGNNHRPGLLVRFVLDQRDVFRSADAVFNPAPQSESSEERCQHRG